MGTVGTILNVCVAVTMLPPAYAGEKLRQPLQPKLPPWRQNPKSALLQPPLFVAAKTAGSVVVAKVGLQMKGASILCIR